MIKNKDTNAAFANFSYPDLLLKVIQENGWVKTDFVGKSMRPLLREGMQILIEKIPCEKIKSGDIILFRVSKFLIAHRVIRIVNNEAGKAFVTKGDNHLFPDSNLIPEVDLIGVVSGAFWKDKPQGNILIKFRLIAKSYVIIGSVLWGFLRVRKYVPKLIRVILGLVTQVILLIHKVIIGLIYKGRLWISALSKK